MEPVPTPEPPAEEVEIPEEEPPLGDLPQTGAVAGAVDPTATLGLLALAASLSAAGLIIMIGRKKGEEED